jgi:hypothetical protein
VKDEFIILNHQLDHFDETLSMNEQFKMKLHFTKSSHRQISLLLNYEKNLYLRLNSSKVFKNENHFKFKLNHVKSLTHRSNFLKISNEIQEFNQKKLKRKNEFEQERGGKKFKNCEEKMDSTVSQIEPLVFLDPPTPPLPHPISMMLSPPPPPPPPLSNVPKLKLNEKVIKKIHWKPIKNISESVNLPF